MAKIGHDVWAIAHAKWSVWVKNQKRTKGPKNDWTTTLELLCAKDPSRKHLIFETWEHFQNGQHWPQCMGYSPCKMVSLGQKLKTVKRCTKRLCDNIKNVVCEKPLQKTPNIGKMRAFSKMAKIGHDTWAIAPAKCSVWVKN